MRLSIFWRLVLTYLVIIAVMTAVNIYALLQIRTLAGLNTEVGSHHHPEIESAKRLLASIYEQVQGEKKYVAVPAATFLEHFDTESKEFQQVLQGLLAHDVSEPEMRLLREVEELQQAHLALFQSQLGESKGHPEATSAYDARREALVGKMAATLQQYIGLHERRIAVGMNESRASSVHAEAVTRNLILVALLFGLGMAAVASYNILRPLRRLQATIQEMGQGNFKASLDGQAPRELRELGETVKWMGTKLQQLDDIKSEFLAHVSHELRTPMASIQEGTHLLLDEIPGPLTQDQRTTLRIMADSSRRLMYLISTILDLSKMQSGMMEYRFVPTDLRRVADISVNKIRLLADAKQVRLMIEAPVERHWVRADSTRIEQVMDNLLSNALKYSPEGAIVRLQMTPKCEEGLLFVNVADSGPGIPAEELPYIFERFYQGRTKSQQVSVGSGLGLALAKKVVEAHGGRIWVESEVGKGTTVRFILYLTKPRILAQRCHSIGVLVLFGLLSACGTLSPPLYQSPYFSTDGGEAKMLQAILRKDSSLTAKCASKNTCDHVFFTRALTSLYESRESAIHNFEKVIAVAPKSQLAVSSRLWLQLLQAGEVSPDQSWMHSFWNGPAIAQTQGVLSQTIERTVRDLLDRELTIQQLRALQDSEAQSLEAMQRELQDQERKAELFNSRRESHRMSVEPATLQSLQRQVSDRDKKIEELSNQLEALKRIDQEMRGKTRPIKPPSSFVPLQQSEPSKP